MRISKFFLLFSFSILLLIGSFYRKFAFDHKLKEVAQKLTISKKTDVEKIISLVHYCYNLKTNSVRNYSYHELNKMFTGKKRFLALYYKTLPINLIPSYYVARYGITYSGPCGAKSRLLLNLLQSVGYTCRLTEVTSPDYTPIHSIVEVKQNDIWSPLDPTLNLYFIDNSGKFIETSLLNRTSEIYKTNINQMLVINGVQNSQDYNYCNVKQMTIFHYIHSTCKAVKVIYSDDRSSTIFHRVLLKYFPEELIHYEIGTPPFYTKPITTPIYLFSFLAFFSFLFYRRKEKVKIRVKQNIEQPEQSLTCVE